MLCSHPAALCEVWLPFNKSMLLLVTTNLELARENPERWESWLRTLVAIAAAPRTVVAANNRYDQAYVEHFTGVRPLYLPTLASYVTARYRGGGARKRGRPFLLWRAHHEMGRTLLAELGSAAPDVAIRGLDQVYPGGAYGKGYQFSDLARHPGVVVVPYTKSVMSFFELYRMNVPVF